MYPVPLKFVMLLRFSIGICLCLFQCDILCAFIRCVNTSFLEISTHFLNLNDCVANISKMIGGMFVTAMLCT